MNLACHQPNFLPWAGFFYKAFLADKLILLDDVQFARGFTWINRNRLKYDQGELWFTVPVWKKGKELQKINEVEVFYEVNWSHKHFQSIIQHYAHAPYLTDHFSFIKNIFQHTWKKLIELNLETIKYLASLWGIEKKLILQSSLNVQAHGSELIVKLCKELGAQVYLAPQMSKKYLNEDLFADNGITINFFKFSSPIYPQLWGDFIPDLSMLDLLLNCGEKSLEIIKKYNRINKIQNFSGVVTD